MPTFEHAVFRCKIAWAGADYSLQVMLEKEWTPLEIGRLEWEFVAFVPNHEVYLSDSFTPEELPYIRLAVFKRQLATDAEQDAR